MFGLRIALVPLFISDVMGRSVGVIGLVLGAFAAGNALAVIPAATYPTGWAGARLLIVGLAASGVAIVALGNVTSLPVFLVIAGVSGVTTGIYMSPLQASVADILGSEARAGTPVAAVQMMADLGAIIGSMTVGWVAEHLSFSWDFIISGVILLIAAVGWVFSPETRPTLDAAPDLLGFETDVEAA